MKVRMVGRRTAEERFYTPKMIVNQPTIDTHSP